MLGQWHTDCNVHHIEKKLIVMNAPIYDTLNLLRTIIACVGVLGAIILINYAFSRDNMIHHKNRTLKHH